MTRYTKIEEQKSYDFMTKIILIGDQNVGKSALLKKSEANICDKTYISTIGPEIKNLFLLDINSKKTIKIQIWDTPGNEKYRNNIENYYKGAKTIAIIFDTNNINSFANSRSWINEANKYKHDNANIILIGNTVDNGELKNTQIKNDLILSFADDKNIPYINFSIQHNSFDDLFSYFIKNII
jgi:small GTP-binding protein